jgi:hypothetical protein
MQPDELKFPAVFSAGTVYFFDRADHWSSSSFGGPSEVKLSGMQKDSVPLHHILSIGCREIPDLGKFSLRLPLFYGLRYSGCSLRYRKVDSRNMEVVEIAPASATPDWPYPSYPPYLPYIPLRLSRSERCDFKKFSSLSIQPNWPISAESLIVVVPASPVLGASIWGPSGDAEGTQIIFECDPASGTVRGFNQCA